MRNVMRLPFALLALVGLGLALAAVPAASAVAQEAHCFPETSFCISGPIRAYWEANGGLSVFGYPIGPERLETVEGQALPVQWFERDRLENHGTAGVLAGRLGDEWLLLTGRVWQQLYPRQSPTPTCRFFAETGFNVCEPFLSYWERNGGLERFGYPLTPTFDEVLDGRVYEVQYFERRRLEEHPEHRGTSYEVQLGLLGSAVSSQRAPVACDSIPAALRRTWDQYARDLGCGQSLGPVASAWQPFEGGQMLWVGSSASTPALIFVINGRDFHGPVWEVYLDTYVDGEPVGTDELPPPGKFAPVRGFGKLWRDNSAVREALGWAASPEFAEANQVVSLAGPKGTSWLIGRGQRDSVLILRAGDPAVALEVAWLP